MGPCLVVDPESVPAYEPDDDPPWDPEEPQWQQEEPEEPAGWVVTGFPGCEIWTYTAVVLVAGLRYALADATTEGLWLQVSALLFELGVVGGGRRLLVLGDGASWIRTWFESLGIDPKAMIGCWWRLRKRCSENLSSAGGPKDRRRALSHPPA